MPGQPLARFAFFNREQLIEPLQIGNLASDMNRALKDAKHRTPDERTLARVCYKGQLMKKSGALSILGGLRKYASLNSLKVDDESFQASRALLEFNFEVVGLSGELSRAVGGMLSVNIDPAADVARIAQTTTEAVLQTAHGKCILVPEAFAHSIAIAASQALRLPQPLQIRPRPANETVVKPLGGPGLEQGKQAYECDDTIELRGEVLRWMRENAEND
ncbi:hypothetical protein [Bradyrhizobium sp. 18]|uniref:hypothetical protein n=1 Tax=Bradyrhizobium sp. 18 TaxID=2782657 RepID=UPI001FF9A0BA|nr:hypothetical protein [Bradyrhizobium sp. 18]MCK1504531.1 hypothetical protein [Bradyrhizobium sp. 18]